MKKIISFLLGVLTLMSFTSCDLYKLAKLDDRIDKEDIFTFVKEEKDELIDCIENNCYDSLYDDGIIKTIHAEYNIVDFACGGAGFGSATSYRGFYYTEKKDMTAIWCAPPEGNELTKSGNGYMWKEFNGDNTYYTEKICTNFYYYEATY